MTEHQVVHRPEHLAVIGEISRRIGWEACAIALHAAGEDTARAARAVWQHPRFAEIQKARKVDHTPCSRRCHHCSRCTHADAYARRGGPYPGRNS
jgi:hypothetical protein